MGMDDGYGMIEQNDETENAAAFLVLLLVFLLYRFFNSSFKVNNILSIIPRKDKPPESA